MLLFQSKETTLSPGDEVHLIQKRGDQHAYLAAYRDLERMLWFDSKKELCGELRFDGTDEERAFESALEFGHFLITVTGMYFVRFTPPVFQGSDRKREILKIL